MLEPVMIGSEVWSLIRASDTPNAVYPGSGLPYVWQSLVVIVVACHIVFRSLVSSIGGIGTGELCISKYITGVVPPTVLYV